MLDEFKILLNDRDYRRWFDDWWATDFSLAGCRQHELPTSYPGREFEEIEFADRRWDLGRMPPHDPSGKINTAFFEPRRARWTDHIVRLLERGNCALSLDGTWLPQLLVDSVSGLAISAKKSFILGNVHLISATLSKLHLRNSFINGDLIYRNSKCTDRVIFTECLIAGSANVSQSNTSTLYFNKSRILGRFECDEVSSEIVISDARLVSEASFLRQRGSIVARNVRAAGLVRISGRDTDCTLVDLRGSKLDNDLHISDASIADAKLASMKCLGQLTIYSSSIDHIQLQRSRISLGTDINSCSIESLIWHNSDINRLSIDDSSINRCDLSRSLFAKDIQVRNCKLTTANFSACHFLDEANFSRNAFSGPISFNQSQFAKGAEFTGSSFDGSTSFMKAIFEESASFTAELPEISNVPGSNRFSTVSFQASRFRASSDRIWCVDFDGRKFTSATNFDGCRFEGAPRFFEADFHENVSFRYTEFARAPKNDFGTFIDSIKHHPNLRTAVRANLNTWNKGQQHYENAYRALKARMSEVGSDREERRFLALELRSRRSRIDPEVSRIESAISYLYDITSDYGESIVRPIVATAIIISIFGAAYYYSTPSNVDLISAMEFSTRQVFKPFDVWSSDGSVIAEISPHAIETGKLAQLESVKASIGLKLLASLQSLCCLTLLFLAALAIRKRFRLG